MKCAKHNCEEYFFSDHVGSCTICNKYIITDNTECELDNLITKTKQELKKLNVLKNKINNYKGD